jgi:hypothetical protein
VVSGTPLVSRHYVALVIGSLSAYVINYAGCRLLVFGRAQGPGASVCAPVEAAASAIEPVQV